MKKILWAGAGLVAGVLMFACGDSSSSTSFEIPTYRNEAALPDSCSMEVAKVDTAYFACFENKWVEVKDSAIVEQLKEGLDEEEVKAKLEELEELLKADVPAKPKSASSEKTDEDVESSDSEEPESSDSEEEECTGRHCKGDDSGSGSDSGSRKSSSSTGGSTSEEVKCVENGFKTLEDYVTWTSSSEGNRLFHGSNALVKKCVGDAKDDATALKNNLQHDTRYQCFAVTSLAGEAEELYESLSMVFDVEVKVGDFVCEGIFSETVYALTLLKTETGSSKFYAASGEMSGSTDEGSSSSEGEGSSASEGDDSSSSEVVESSASVEESSSSVEEGEPCGDTTYDPETQYCAGGTTPTDMPKCGDAQALYNPETHYCAISGDVTELTAACGTTLYNPEKQYCQADEVKDIAITATRNNIFVKGDTTTTTLTVENATSCSITYTNQSKVEKTDNSSCSWTFTNANDATENAIVKVSLNSVNYGDGANATNVSKNITVFGTGYGRFRGYNFLDAYVTWIAYSQTTTSTTTSLAVTETGIPCTTLLGSSPVEDGLKSYTYNSTSESFVMTTGTGKMQTIYTVKFTESGSGKSAYCKVTASVKSSSGRI